MDFCPEDILLSPSNLQFRVEVDPTTIPRGTTALGEVLGLDSKNLHLGPLFRVPAVIRPEKSEESKEFIFDAVK